MAWGDDPGHQDLAAVAAAVRRLSPLFSETGPYPCEAEGLENFPHGQPTLLVANHSGGVMIPDVWGLGYVWYSAFPHRPIHSLAHELMFKVGPIGKTLARIGVMRADREVAHRCLTEWKHDLIVLPGGDRDVFRPYSDRFKVHFGGRKGYAKTALRAGVPIIPTANSGAHETLIVLRRGRRIAKALGLHSLVRSDVFPVTLSFPWGLTIGPWPNLPVPARFRYRFGAPIQLEEKPVPEPSRAQIDELDRRVRAALQEQLDALEAVTSSIPERLLRGLRA